MTAVSCILPVLWKSFISNIPAFLAISLTHIIVGLYIVMIIIFVMLSVIRCLVCHEVVWFANLNENVVDVVVNGIALVITIIHRIVAHLMFFAKGKFIELPCLLSDELLHCNVNIKARTPVFIYILFTSSLLLELYIGMIIKKLSCTRFIPVTIGHMYMIAGIHVITNYQSTPMIQVIQASFTVTSVQFMYVLRQKEFTIELLKKCFKVPTNTVVPVNENIELNDFGIYIGSQARRDPITESGESDELGDVYVG